jgi:Ca2+-binding RTX toxin-like protein
MFQAAPGETNTVQVAVSDTDKNQYGNYARATVSDTTTPLVAGDHCQSVDVHTATCTAGPFGFTTTEVHLGDGNDSATLGALTFSYMSGDDGNDVLTGSDGGYDTIVGGPGDDTLNGRGGADWLDPAWGDPAVDQAGADTYQGGGGAGDTLDYGGRTAGVAATQDGAANDGEVGEHDNVAGDIEEILGGGGDDFIVGGAGPQSLSGNGGNDRILGGAGADTIDGGPGDDRVDAGAGNDLISGDFASVGADDVHGRAGVDRFVSHEAPSTISLDDAANDGLAGQNIHSDVENVTSDSPRVTLWGSAGANDLTVRAPDAEFICAPSTEPGAEMHGGAGNDTLTMYYRRDRLYGDDGADTINGGCGTDYLSGGKGFDTIYARDGDPDVVSCGAGIDVVTADKGDTVAKDCEIVYRIA